MAVTRAPYPKCIIVASQISTYPVMPDDTSCCSPIIIVFLMFTYHHIWIHRKNNDCTKYIC